MTTWPRANEEHPPPEVLRDLDTAARVLADLEGCGVEIALVLDAAGRLCISAVDGDGRVHRPATTELLDLLVAPGRHRLTLDERL